MKPTAAIRCTLLTVFFAAASVITTGCNNQSGQFPNGNPNTVGTPSPADNTSTTQQSAGLALNATGQVVRVSHLRYDARTQTATLYVNPGSTYRSAQAPLGSASADNAGNASVLPTGTDEQSLDIMDHGGIINYTTAHLPGKSVRWIRVVSLQSAPSKNPPSMGKQADQLTSNGRTTDNQSLNTPTNPTPRRALERIHRSSFILRVPDTAVFTPEGAGPAGGTGAGLGESGNGAAGSGLMSGGMAAGFAGGGRIGLPPGVSMDGSIAPYAGLGAPAATKYDAVLRVARSKLGTPYIWGHSEDRGQYGFDCSNFTAYVYHHALGYIISPLSVVQASSVGYPVAKRTMQPGDLLIFEGGKHVGIYVGNTQMIDAGGGKGKVSYMTIGPGSYWGNHLTAVKRMF